MPALKTCPARNSSTPDLLDERRPGFHDLANCSLAELESVLPSAFYPSTAHIFLQIGLPGKLDFVLERDPDAALQGWVQAHTRAAGTMLMQFLGMRGLLIPHYSPPKACEAVLPVICDIPTTGELRDALAFGLDLFRECGRSTSEPDLRCFYFEYTGNSWRKERLLVSPPVTFVGVM